MNTVFIVLTVVLGVRAGYDNDWDEQLSVTCESSRKSINRIQSIHDNGAEDRRWDIECSDLPGIESLRWFRETCSWTSHYVNDWDEAFNYNCPYDGYITGMISIHDNGPEDRRWKFRCCSLQSHHTQSCLSKMANEWDQQMNFRVPDSYVLTGVFSYHSNKKEDRLYQYRYCRLKKSC